MGGSAHIGIGLYHDLPVARRGGNLPPARLDINHGVILSEREEAVSPCTLLMGITDCYRCRMIASPSQ